MYYNTEITGFQYPGYVSGGSKPTPETQRNYRSTKLMVLR